MVPKSLNKRSASKTIGEGRKMNKAVSLVAILSIVSILLVLPFAVRGASAQLYIDPALVEKHPADVGTTFTVSVKVQDIADLFGFDITITWDNTLITFSSLDITPLNTIWPQGFFEPLPGYQTGAGSVRYAAVATGGNGFTGSGTLFKITFTVASATPGQTLMHFGCWLSDSLGNPITHTNTDGTYKMLAQPQLPVGGEWAPINSWPLIAPWIMIALIAASALGGVHIKYRKGKQ
jgi:hypothetical protein